MEDETGPSGCRILGPWVWFCAYVREGEEKGGRKEGRGVAERSLQEDLNAGGDPLPAGSGPSDSSCRPTAKEDSKEGPCQLGGLRSGWRFLVR